VARESLGAWGVRWNELAFVFGAHSVLANVSPVARRRASLLLTPQVAANLALWTTWAATLHAMLQKKHISRIITVAAPFSHPWHLLGKIDPLDTRPLPRKTPSTKQLFKSWSKDWSYFPVNAPLVLFAAISTLVVISFHLARSPRKPL